MPKRYVVDNPQGANIRKTMSTLNNLPVGKFDNGNEFDVFQEYAISQLGTIYTWGRISENPDGNGQHRYVALYRPGKVFCSQVSVSTETPQSTPPDENWQKEMEEWMESIETRVSTLEKLAGL